MSVPLLLRGQSLARVACVAVLLLHLIAGIAALFLLPHGFALTDVHLWSNTVVPGAAVLVTAVAVVRYLFLRSSPMLLGVLVAAAAGGWLVAIATGGTLYPASMPASRLAAPAVVALALVTLAWWSKERVVVSAVALVAGGALGALEVFAQRAAEPSTRPAGGTLAEVQGEAVSDDAATGQIVVPCGKGKIRVNPMLTFQSRSPDRTWVLLAPAQDLRKQRALTHYTKTANGLRASYTDDGESTLVVTKDKSGAVDIEALTRLSAPVYAHLDTWTTIHLSFDATVSFGPTGPTRFSFEPADYPTGRPMQLAYLGEDLAFHVVRARDAEKGPFAEVATGHLTRDEALTIEIRPRGDKEDEKEETPKPKGKGKSKGKDKKDQDPDRDRGCRLVFKDWSAQLSTEPSPTAGSGLPQNSIQFFARDNESLVVLALAETGPGRGYDSVGHAAGTYRNRLRVEAIR